MSWSEFRSRVRLAKAVRRKAIERRKLRSRLIQIHLIQTTNSALLVVP